MRDDITESENADLHKALYFGIIVTGNIVDNVHSPKTIAITMQVWLGMNWIGTSYYTFVGLKHGCQNIQTTLMAEADIAQILGASIVLINTLQVYNWFDKRYIQMVLITYFCMQFVGYSLPITYIEECLWNLEPIYYLICGSVMVCLAVVDCWFFYFNPLQKNIFIDQAEANRKAAERRIALSDRQDSATGFGAQSIVSLDQAPNQLMSSEKSNILPQSKLAITRSTFNTLQQ